MPSQSPDILKDFETFAASKNPLSMLFSIAKIRENVLDFSDSLINSIETSNYDDTAKRFAEINEEYREAGFYKIIYAYYLHSGKFARQKAYLDQYFEESYYRDPDFFFFVLEKHRYYHALFECLKILTANPVVRSDFAKLEATEDRTAFLRKLPGIDREEESWVSHTELHEFLLRFTDFDFSAHPEFNTVKERSARSGRIVARDLLFASLRTDPEGVPGGFREFWAKAFVHTPFLREELVDLLPNEEVLDCFSYLRNKFLRTPKYNVSMTSGNIYQNLITKAKIVSKGTVLRKLAFLNEVDEAMGSNPIFRERFLNVLRKGIVYDNSIDLVDVLFGIDFFSREVFYEIKRRTAHITQEPKDDVAFVHLKNVKALAIFLNDSYVMRLVRPFLIENLSEMFNKRADRYYFVKFLLTIHLSENYKEYKILSGFFLEIEAYSKTGIYGYLSRFVQFGYLNVAAVLMFFFAPLGTFLAISGIFAARAIRRKLAKKNPQLFVRSNFQIPALLSVFAVVSLTFGLTFAREDNQAIAYRNFQTVVNAMSLVSSESAKLILEDMAQKSSVLESGGGEYRKSKLEKIDYVNGKNYRGVSEEDSK